MKTIDLTPQDMLLMYLLLIIPLAFSFWLKLGNIREMIFAVLRMTIQLILIGLYLEVLFKLNSLPLNIAWIVVMLTVANASILRQSGLSFRRMFPLTFLGTAVAITLVATFFVVLVLAPTPLYDARYLIPISGMIMGNCMRGNVIAMERFYSGIRRNEKEFITYQMLGATLSEATRPYMRSALRAAVGPMLATIATIGIVSLPGMMTGQILGGSVPMLAIKYQIAIMLSIFCAMMIASTLSIIFTRKTAFDAYGMLRPEIFAKTPH
jgi:UDP-glucose/iron transport system permease protein